MTPPLPPSFDPSPALAERPLHRSSVFRVVPAGKPAAMGFGEAVRRRALADHVVQGEQRVTDDPDVRLTTILGSCVSACLNDPFAKVGGMNHFLLPGAFDQAGPGHGERIGVHAMELLINEMLQRGAARRRLEAKVFGGACLNAALNDIGGSNAAFALQFLRREGIAVVAECLGGRLARRIQFWPASGRARRSFLADAHPAARVTPAAVPAIPSDAGTLELF